MAYSDPILVTTTQRDDVEKKVLITKQMHLLLATD